ncbi:MAG: nitrogen fixation protein NifZ [Nitrospirae bacterium]|nr:nitrogen fixation protein NifZ [Nitrospirota bacterium]
MKGDFRTGRFQAGQTVVLLRDITNDGSYPSFRERDFLAEEGDRGEILGVGYQEEKKRVVYFVGLLTDNRVIGCFEEDLLPLARPVRHPGRRESSGVSKNLLGGG